MYKKILTYPKLLIIFLLFFLSIATYFSKEFKLDASADTLLLENDPDLKYLREINQKYGSEEFFILTYEPKGRINIQSINELEKFVNKINNLQWVSKTISIINAPLLQSSDESLMDRIKNLKYITNPEIKFDVALNELVKSPVYKNLIISEDAKTLGIVVYLKDNKEYLKQTSNKSILLTIQNERKLIKEEEIKLEKINIEIEKLKKKMKK